MPDNELLQLWPVQLTTAVKEIVSRPGVRVNCAACGEEIINEREIRQGDLSYCQGCFKPAYYRLAQPVETALFSEHLFASAD
jgi:formylmethanofuran dehydrogenase subunit E